MKKNSGITLLALIITIIIMLILAGVTISIVGGSDGIVAKAEKAISETDKAAMQEDAEISVAAIKMNYYEDYAANRARFANAKAFIIAELEEEYTTSRGAKMKSVGADEISYTFKGVATTITIDENGKVTLGESSGTDDEEGTITPAVQYTLTYNANGGTGAPTDNNEYSEGSTVEALFNTVPTRAGYTFLGWATTPNATEAIYTSVGTTTFEMGTANVILYAVWKEELPDHSYMFDFDATTGTILGIKEEYYGDTPNVDYYEKKAQYTDYGTGYGWCMLKEPVDTLVIPSKIDNVEVKNVRNIAVLNVKKIVIEEGIETIGGRGNVHPVPDLVVQRCTVAEVQLPSTLKEIKEYAFECFSKLTNIDIPENVTSIGTKAFYSCANLKNVNILGNVTTIGSHAFYRCTSLKSINIPASVTYIGTAAFQECTSFSSITVDNGNSIYDSRNNCNAIIETATNTLIVGCANTTIPEGVTSIEDWAFYKCTGLSNINIPNSVTSIGRDAFSSCTNLKSINIPSKLRNIGSFAFTDCESLTTVTIDSTIASGLTARGSYSSLVYNATTIYIKSGLTVGSYVTSNYNVATSDKDGYVKYVKN